MPQAPERLWLRGRSDALQPAPRIAIVGSRSASGYGLDQALRFGYELARAGFVIVSGMARGVDQAAHTGALEGGASDRVSTLAVLGNGVDRPWPAWHELPRLLECGAVLSEFPPGQAPRRHHFPLRNRLIAGLSQAVLVIEAAHASGSLITAHWGLEFGREVFALPGRVDQPMAAGTLRLLREGARAVGSPAQLLQDLGWEWGSAAASAPRAPQGRVAQAIWQALEGESLSVDELVGRGAGGLAALLAELARLQLDGFVVRGPGGLYRRALPTEREAPE